MDDFKLCLKFVLMLVVVFNNETNSFTKKVVNAFELNYRFKEDIKEYKMW